MLNVLRYGVMVNYLAHLYLSRPMKAGWVGALWPDMVARSHRRVFPTDPVLRESIALHRLVDRLTDVHPGYLSAKQRLFADQGRFAGVVADVVFDHLLSRQWLRWQPLAPFGQPPEREAFLQSVEASLQLSEAQVLMDDQMRQIVGRMISGRWLWLYDNLAGLEQVLWMMSRRFEQRFSRQVRLDSAVQIVADDPDGFARDFESLITHLINETKVFVEMGGEAE